jgi:uncharacterized glyoxalase superfamily protein PhnB
MKDTPSDWPRVSPAIFYDDALAAIDWLCRAFDFEVRIKVLGNDGRLAHSELTYGGGVIMVAQSGKSSGGTKRSTRSPQSLDGVNTQSLMLYVDDVDTHCARARAAGAVIDAEPAVSDYGEEYWSDRSYGCRDPEQHQWWFAQRLRTGPQK